MTDSVRTCRYCEELLPLDAASHRVYCSDACRAAASRRRRESPEAARRRQLESKAKVDAALGGEGLLETVMADLQEQVQHLVGRSEFLESLYGERLSRRVVELNRLVQDVLVPAALVVDTARGATQTELAELYGVERSTVRRRYGAAAEQMRHYARRRGEALNRGDLDTESD